MNEPVTPGTTPEDIVVRLRREGRVYTHMEAAAEIERLRGLVVTFCAPFAAEHAAMHGLPKGHLHPVHYDILKECGARMAGFTRSAGGDHEYGP